MGAVSLAIARGANAKLLHLLPRLIQRPSSVFGEASRKHRKRP